MSQYLILGNTNTKIFADDNKFQMFLTKDFLEKKFFIDYDNEDTYVASVIPSINFENAYMISCADIAMAHSVLAIDRVGIDRLLNCYAAIDDFTDFMVVDFGTAISISVVQTKVFKGGFILPGIDMSVRALSEGTAALKKIYFTEPQQFAIGVDTQQAISSGIFWAVIGAVKELYQKTFQGKAALILTGGNAEIFAQYCKDFSQNILLDKNLQLKGVKKVVAKIKN